MTNSTASDHAVSGAQPFHQFGDIGVGQRLVVGLVELVPLRQGLVEVTLPARRVGLVLRDVAERPRRVDDRFDPAAQS